MNGFVSEVPEGEQCQLWRGPLPHLLFLGSSSAASRNRSGRHIGVGWVGQHALLSGTLI